jgi:DNA-directed RNA polymerase subunit RPC12/RpoP
MLRAGRRARGPPSVSITQGNDVARFDQPENEPQTGTPPQPASAFSAGLPQAGDAVPASLTAHSEFIKRAKCVRCGAPKTRPSKTAYLYCDYCGALVDYDFRLANQGTNAGLTNTIYQRIITPCQADIIRAKGAGDYEAYRQIMRYVFGQWITECPDAVSPRVKTDPEFRERMVAYCAEAAVYKDMDWQQQQLDAQMNTMIAQRPRIPTPDGAWQLGGDIMPMAELWKQQMDLAYAGMAQHGITAMDPDDPPPGVAVKMEYSTFCQAWLPHISAADGERVLALFGLTADYTQVQPQPLEQHACGGCGAELQTVVGARVVVCEDCGRQVDIAAGAMPCRNCGAPLNFPVHQTRLNCPYCRTDTQRV